MTPLAQKIQALLFTAEEAVSFSDLASLTKASDEELRNACIELSQELAGSGLTLVSTNTSAQLATSPSVGEFLAQFTTEDTPELSRSAMETLSIIAYRGPIARFDVDIIRGVDSRRMIRQLLRRGMVRQIRVSGKTPLYDITEEFLSHIGIAKREDMPNFEKLSSSEEISRILQSPS